MGKSKVAVTLDQDALRRLDRLVEEGRFPNRSQALEAALGQMLDRLDRRRLAEECAKLDPAAEQALAEEGIGEDTDSWPAY